MSKENKNKCKYCHLTGHVIDKCPTIICKHCKAIGHPNWLCKSNPNAENVKSPLSPNLRNKKSIYAFDSTNSLSKTQSQPELQNNDLVQSEKIVLETMNENKKVNHYKAILKESDDMHCNSLFSSGANRVDVTENVNKKSDIKNVYVGFKEDFKQKVNETNEIVKEKIINLQYYQKMIDSKWGDLIETL